MGRLTAQSRSEDDEKSSALIIDYRCKGLYVPSLLADSGEVIERNLRAISFKLTRTA